MGYFLHISSSRELSLLFVTQKISRLGLYLAMKAHGVSRLSQQLPPLYTTDTRLPEQRSYLLMSPLGNLFFAAENTSRNVWVPEALIKQLWSNLVDLLPEQRTLMNRQRSGSSTLQVQLVSHELESVHEVSDDESHDDSSSLQRHGGMTLSLLDLALCFLLFELTGREKKLAQVLAFTTCDDQMLKLTLRDRDLEAVT